MRRVPIFQFNLPFPFKTIGSRIIPRPTLTGIPDDVKRIPLEECLARICHQDTPIVGTFDVQEPLEQDPSSGGRVVTTEDGWLQSLSVDLEGYYIKPAESDSRTTILAVGFNQPSIFEHLLR